MNRTKTLLLGGSLLGAASCVAEPAPPGKLTDCSNAATPGSRYDIPVGGVRIFGSAQSVGCAVLPTTPNAEYVFVVSNANPTLDVEKNFTFLARPDTTATTAASIAVSPALVADGSSGGFDAGRVAAELGAASEQELAIRNYERLNLNPRGALAALAAERTRLGASGSAALRGALANSAVPTVGQSLPFRVPGATKPCDTFASINGVVKYVGTHAVIVQDVAAPTNGFTDADFQGIANEFDNVIYPTDVSYFGQPTDVDLNSGYIYILLTPEINKLTPRNTTSGLFAGFFFAGDYFPRTGSNSCNQSNGAEVFYLLVPDPAGTFSKPQSTSEVRRLTSGTVAHEFQHMINAGIRFNNPTAKFEDVWLDEGLAHFAEEAVGRAADGYGDLQPLSFNDVRVSIPNYDAYFDQNLRRFALWLAHPDTSSGISVHADENLSSRGAAWALVRYTSEKFSGGDVRAFTRALASGPEIGVANLTRRANVPLDSILSGFQVANYADDLAITGLDPKYTYTSWNLRDAVPRANGSTTYPLAVNQIATSGGQIQGESRTGSATYVRYLGTASTPPVVARLVDASASALATWTGARLYVLRTK